MSNYYPLFSEIASLSYSLELSQYPLCPLCFRKVVISRTKKSATRSKKRG